MYILYNNKHIAKGGGHTPIQYCFSIRNINMNVYKPTINTLKKIIHKKNQQSVTKYKYLIVLRHHTNEKNVIDQIINVIVSHFDTDIFIGVSLSVSLRNKISTELLNVCDYIQFTDGVDIVHKLYGMIHVLHGIEFFINDINCQYVLYHCASEYYWRPIEKDFNIEYTKKDDSIPNNFINLLNKKPNSWWWPGLKKSVTNHKYFIDHNLGPYGRQSAGILMKKEIMQEFIRSMEGYEFEGPGCKTEIIPESYFRTKYDFDQYSLCNCFWNTQHKALESHLNEIKKNNVDYYTVRRTDVNNGLLQYLHKEYMCNQLKYFNIDGTREHDRTSCIEIYGRHDNWHMGTFIVSRELDNLVTEFNNENNNYCEICVMNGEGTIHDNQQSAINKIQILKKKKKEKKKTLLINTVFENMTHQNTLNIIKNNVDYVSVREFSSFNEIKKIRKDVHINIDLSFFHKNVYKKTTFDKMFNKNICIQGGYYHINNSKLKSILSDYNLSNVGLRDKDIDYDKYKLLLNNVCICISGFQHEFIINSSFKKMTIIIAGNTNKVKGLLDYADVNIPIFTHTNIYKYLENTTLENYFNTYKTEYEKLYHFLDNQQKLTIAGLMKNRPMYSIERDYRIINMSISDIVPLYKNSYDDFVKSLAKNIRKNYIINEPLILLKMNKNEFLTYTSTDSKNTYQKRPNVNIFDNNDYHFFIKLGNECYVALDELNITHVDCVIFDNYKDYMASKFHKKTHKDVFYQ